MDEPASKPDVVLLQDPYDPTAIAFAQRARELGVGVVAFYTSPKNRHYGERRHPELRTDLILDRFDVDLDHLADFARAVTERYRVRAVLPWMEPTVEVAAELARHIDLGWNDPVTVSRFRDKVELKRHIARNDPSVRLPWFHELERITDLDGVELPERVVVKPRSGFGNQSIGMFDGTDRDGIASHLATGDEPWIVEEFIGGIEYHVNGQIRRDGTVTILTIMQYHRVAVNGYETVYSSEERLHTDHPRFAPLAEYATCLLQATDLVRSPFHLEAKVDDRGPALVDLGARFLSEGGALTIDSYHPTRPPAVEIAVRDYLGVNDVATGPVDWTHHDSFSSAVLYGISETTGRVMSVRGYDAVEEMPEFLWWNYQATRGDRLWSTRELRGAPWIVTVGYPRDQGDRHHELLARIRALIVINDPVTMFDRLSTLAVRLRGLLTDRLSWEIARRRRR